MEGWEKKVEVIKKINKQKRNKPQGQKGGGRRSSVGKNGDGRLDLGW